MSINAFSAAVTEARKRAKLTQRELARRARAAQPLVARIESGRANPTVDTLDRLLGAAGFELRVELVPKEAPDPVVEAYKRDVDRTLLRENLRRTVDERMQTLVAMSEFVDEIRRATLKAKRKK
jgi:transcriptional regulator with XRE-family HTH domain